MKHFQMISKNRYPGVSIDHFHANQYQENDIQRPNYYLEFTKRYQRRESKRKSVPTQCNRFYSY